VIVLKESIKSWARHLPGARWIKRVLTHSPASVAETIPVIRAPKTGLPAYRAEPAFDLRRYWLAVEQNYANLANPFRYYECLVEELSNTAETRWLPLYELDGASEPSKRVVGLRHDIDDDPVTGVRAARYLARQGICGSFYLLHTSNYYGQMIGDRFVRRPELEDWIKAFLVSGCELGLHNDALGVCKLLGKDGAQAVLDEIYWLRQLGATIRGTVAHNSGPVYQAENYEVFRERCHWRRTTHLTNGLRLPLGSLSEKEIGLTYEGTFSATKQSIDLAGSDKFLRDLKNADVRSPAWMKAWLLENPYRNFTLDFQFWLVGKDQWFFSGRHDGKDYFQHDLKLGDVIQTFRSLPLGTKTLIVLHPEYFRN
jgi:hypothetical protein